MRHSKERLPAVPRAQQKHSRPGCRCSAAIAGEEERLRALRMLGVVQQPVGREFGSITRCVKQVLAAGEWVMLWLP